MLASLYLLGVLIPLVVLVYTTGRQISLRRRSPLERRRRRNARVRFVNGTYEELRLMAGEAFGALRRRSSRRELRSEVAVGQAPAAARPHPRRSPESAALPVVRRPLVPAIALAADVSASSAPTHCHACRREIPIAARLCRHCGAPLVGAPRAA